jgi:outer membrane protein TolC
MKTLKTTVALSVFLVQAGAQALTLPEFLGEVAKRHKEFQSYDISREAAEDRRVAGDIGLAPVFTLSASYLSDEKLPSQSFGTKLTSTQYNAGLGKQFSTGTYLGVTGNLQHNVSTGVPAQLQPLIGSPDYSTGTLGVNFSQSLWKNAFGHGIRLRQERESVASSLEKQSFNLKQRQILFNAESAYWDYLYQQEDLAEKGNSLDRSRKIESWLKRRFNDGIADKADFLNAQALSASRELTLAMTRDQARASEKALRDFLELGANDKLPRLDSDFKKARSIDSMIGAGQGQVVRLDTYMSALEAKVKNAVARETKDALRPDLVLAGSYATNSYSAISQNEALSHISNPDTPTSQIQLKFSYTFDTDSKVSQEQLSRKEALAAQLQSERSMLESESSWSELQRRYAELLQQLETAERLNRLQLSRAKEQQVKLGRGRAVTSDVIISEEDAATSSLSLNRLRAEARKLEAQSRLFIRLSEADSSATSSPERL